MLCCLERGDVHDGLLAICAAQLLVVFLSPEAYCLNKVFEVYPKAKSPNLEP